MKKKNQQMTKKQNYPACEELNGVCILTGINIYCYNPRHAEKTEILKWANCCIFENGLFAVHVNIKMKDVYYTFNIIKHTHTCPISSRERSGSVVECLTQDQMAVGSSLTSVTALWSLSKTHLS